MSKAELRRAALALRDSLPEHIRQTSSLALAIHAEGWNGKDFCVSAYHAIGSEIDPAPFLQGLARAGAKPALPVLLDNETMVFRTWDKSKPLVPVGFGTLGPDGDQPEVLPDLILAPLAAFSATGQRIGYGKGHYDRCLSKVHAAGHVPAYVGLAFDEQEVPPFEAEPHDITLDGVLTPTGLRVFKQGQARLAPFLRATDRA